MKSAIVIDRHVLASNASSFNTAWETFGWTPAIEGVRAGRLEEQVPWATAAARADDPAWLSGPADDVLAPANFDRLDSGFLPLDGRLGFSVWGAIGERRRRGPEWRVATHTLLFDDDAFDLMAGHPEGLMRGTAVARWFHTMVAAQAFASPTALEPIRLERSRVTRTAFEAARRAEIGRLRAILAPTPDRATSLERELAAVFEALGRVRGGGSIRHVALRGTADRRAELLIRLAWLALPLADRAETWFVTAQRRTDAPRATLVALPASEWGPYVPHATRLVDGQGANDASAGRRRWAHAIARPDEAEEHAHWAARAEVRDWRLIARDDITRAERRASWRDRWRAGGTSLELARELIDAEAGAHPADRPRLRAAGHIAALAVRGREDGADLLIGLASDHRQAATPFLRAAVRTLGRGSPADRRSALRLRCRAAAPDSAIAPADELFRLLERERPLLAEAAHDVTAAELLFRAAVAAGREGRVTAEPLMAAALPGLDALDAALVDLARSADLHDPRAQRLVLGTIDRALDVRPADVPLTDVVVELLDSLGGSVPTGTLADRLLRLVWLDHSRGGHAPSAFLERHPAAAVPVLAGLLVTPAPLPLHFLLRRLLLEAATRVRPDDRLARLMPALDSYCPALAERLAMPRARDDQEDGWMPSA